MATNRTTPFIKRMRTNGGTLFSLNSSIEDIGLNINEKNNIVKISHFALLNIPSIENSNNLNANWFNVQAIAGAWEYENDSLSIKDGRVLVAESFQNYASNLETVLLDQATYNPGLNNTISERVFWKWLKETGAIRWTDDGSSNWTEDTASGYSSVVKYIGEVAAGNVRRDTFGTYNETYILLPTSHGQTAAYFKQTVDSNYNHGFSIGELTEKISSRDNWLQPHPDGLAYDAYYDYVDASAIIGAYTLDVSSFSYTGSGWWYTAQGTEPASSTSNYYFTDTSAYIGDPSLYNSDLTYTGPAGFSYRRSNIDCLELELDLNNLKTIYSDTTLTYNKLATTNSVATSFDFNTCLVYYTVYNSTGEDVLATNMLGVMFLDAPSGNSALIGSGGILLPSIEKIQTQSDGFGTSYSLRLNIKSDNTIDDTQATVVDYSTSNVTYAEDFNDTMAELKKTIQILNQQTSTINFISTSYNNTLDNQSSLLNKLNSQQNTINSIESFVLDTGALQDYHLIQDASILQNLTYDIIQDASIISAAAFGGGNLVKFKEPSTNQIAIWGSDISVYGTPHLRWIPGTGIESTLDVSIAGAYYGNGGNLTGVMGGTITSNQIAFGQTTADFIEGTSNMTWDDNEFLITVPDNNQVRKIKAGNSNSYIELGNTQATGFAPSLFGHMDSIGTTTENNYMLIQSNIDDSLDVKTSTSNALMVFKSYKTGGTITARNLFEWRNDTTAHMTMDSSGNLGLGFGWNGTPNAGIQLDVSGGIQATGDVSANAYFGDGSNLSGVSYTFTNGLTESANIARLGGIISDASTTITTAAADYFYIETISAGTDTANIEFFNGAITITGTDATPTTSTINITKSSIEMEWTNSGSTIHPKITVNTNGIALDTSVGNNNIVADIGTGTFVITNDVSIAGTLFSEDISVDTSIHADSLDASILSLDPRQDMKMKSIILSVTQVQALASSPVELVPAVADTQVQVIGGSVRLDPSTNFASSGNGAIYLQYNVSPLTDASSYIRTTHPGFVTSATVQYSEFVFDPADCSSQVGYGSALQVTAADDFTAGSDSSIYVSLQYMLIT